MTQTLPQHLSLSNDWGTPRVWIERVKRVFGGEIDLDPASSALHNARIGSKRFYSEVEDGLILPWDKKTFFNPPYGRRNGRSNQELWIEKALKEYACGNVEEMIALVNAATDTNWFFDNLWEFPVCFVHPRIKFIDPAGAKSRPTHPNAFVYIGKRHVFEFAKVFTGETIGHVVFPDSERILASLQRR